jgi:transcriptional regulator with XRE-family HTH domain
MKHKVTPEFAIACLKNFLKPWDGKRNSAYKVANETRLTPSTISNYMNGRSKPSGRSLEVLDYYFRLEEYAEYLDSVDHYESWSDEGVANDGKDENEGIAGEPVPFVAWIEEKKVRPVVVITARQELLAGYLSSDNPEQQDPKQTDAKISDNVGTINDTDHDSANKQVRNTNLEHDASLEAAREQIDALHALVLAQKKTIDNQDRTIKILEAELKELRQFKEVEYKEIFNNQPESKIQTKQ